MRETYDQFAARGAEVLVVVSTDLDMAGAIAEVLRAKYPVLSDPTWQTFYTYGMGSGFGVPLPGTFVLDQEGIIRFSWAAPFSPVFTPPEPKVLLDVVDTLI